MSFKLPRYNYPNFNKEPFLSAPNVKTSVATIKGACPEGYHATSIYPEYFKIDDKWHLVSESRMDCVITITDNSSLEVKEFRNVNVGDKIILGRNEDCSEGIYVHAKPFIYEDISDAAAEKEQLFSFRTGRSRETSFSMDYDDLYELLKYERENGYIVWVLGPAVIFDHDSKNAMAQLINNGFADAIFAGNALAVHDLEGSLLGTALGQNIYSQASDFNGHYNHIDIINKVRAAGSVKDFIRNENITTGVVHACVENKIPLILAGSIRDDGPLPEVISNVYEAQEIMRNHCRKATTIICLATMLHTIATGNLTPIYKVEGNTIRPIYIYSVDVSEFAANKLRDRGSLEVTSFVTNVQDFVVNISKHLF